MILIHGRYIHRLLHMFRRLLIESAQGFGEEPPGRFAALAGQHLRTTRLAPLRICRVGSREGAFNAEDEVKLMCVCVSALIYIYIHTYMFIYTIYYIRYILWIWPHMATANCHILKVLNHHDTDHSLTKRSISINLPGESALLPYLDHGHKLPKLGYNMN